MFGHIHRRRRGQVEGCGEYWILPAFDEAGVHLRQGPGALRFCDRRGETLPEAPAETFT